ncbi:hypothetical protein CK802_08460 [Brucella abortus]|nr:hypothetical protein CK802_08460 [Brucella abortus]
MPCRALFACAAFIKSVCRILEHAFRFAAIGLAYSSVIMRLIHVALSHAKPLRTFAGNALTRRV